MFFLVLVTAASFGWFIIAREVAYDQSQLEAHGTLLTKSFARLIQNTVDLSDRAALQLLTDRIIEDEDVTQCTVFNREGKTLAHASKNLPDRHSRYLLNHPLSSREGEKLGTLHLTLSLAKIDERMDGLKRDLLLVTLGVVGVGTLFTLIFTRLLIHPIEKLASATERVARGELASRVNIRSRDEIGDLADAFNQMTRQIRESQEDLEKKVEERTRELEMANLELKELDETRMKFIGVASHELKTPLTAIKSNIDFILSEKEGRLPNHLKSYLLTIQRNTNRIQTRMNLLLDLARIRSGHLSLLRERICLSKVVPAYINEIKPIDKHLSVQIEIPEHLFVSADREGLHDIFINLLSNAFKFTPEGGEVSVIATLKDSHALLRVRDTGIGIPADKLQKIFDEFYQVEGSKHGGAGLGLAITRHLVQEHGGEIWVESQIGKGSTFYLTLPLDMEETHDRSLSS
jgi:signal transduction histidine kinase